MQKEETDFHKEQAETSSSPQDKDSSQNLLAEPTERPGKDWKAGLLQLKNRISTKFLQVLPNPWKGKITQKWNRDFIKKQIENFDPQTFSDWASKAVQKKGATFYGTLATLILSTYFLADLSALILGEYIPDPPSVRMGKLAGGGFSNTKTMNDYKAIFSRNLFNSQGIIPGEEALDNQSSNSGPPQKSTLPLNLIGTLIMTNEKLSIATIEDKAAGSAVFPVRMDDEIPGKLVVQSVEARKVIFLNKQNGRREYLEIPEDLLTQNPKLTPGKASGGAGIEKVAPNQFNVSRSEVDKALADFNNILTQARAVPNFENGVASGYKLFQIVPGSIYDKLGIQNGDVIVGLNGSPINDPAKAFEMLNELKVSNHLELQVKKDGKQSTYTYDIR